MTLTKIYKQFCNRYYISRLCYILNLGVGGASSVPFFLEKLMLGRLIELCDSFENARAASAATQDGNYELAKKIMVKKRKEKGNV